MANHGYVTSRKFIRKEMVDRALTKINEKFLFGEMKIEYFEAEEGNTYNTHYWHVWFENDKGESFEERNMWIPYKKPKTFEIRHGGGSDFIWWVDLLIRNAVATECNGMISDDADNCREPAETYPSLPFRKHKIRQWLDIELPLSRIRMMLKSYKDHYGDIIPQKHLIQQTKS